MKTGLWRKGGLACAALLLGGLALAAPVPNDPTALKEVPARAPLVIHVRGVQGVAERFIDLLKQVAPTQTGGMQKKIQEFLEQGEDGRKLRGLAKDGPIFVAFTEMPKIGDDNPKVAVIAAITNYRDLVDNVLKPDERKALKKSAAGYESTVSENGQTIYFVNRKDFAVITPNKELAESFTKKQPGLNEQLSKEMAARLLASDVGVYLSLDFVNKEYAEQIKQGKALAEQGIRALKETVDKSQRAQFEIVEKAIGPIFQAVEDSKGLLLAGELRPAGVNFLMQTDVRKDSPTGKFLSEARVSSFKDLERLPAGQMFYTGLQASPSLLKMLGGMVFGVMGDLNEKGMKGAKEALDELFKARPDTQVGSAGLPPNGIQVWTCAEPAKALDAQIKLLESLTTGHTYLSGMLKAKPVIKRAAQKYDGIEFTSVKMTWDLEKMLGDAGANLPEEKKKTMLEMMKKLIGEQANVWYGTDSKHLYQVTAHDWAEAQKLLGDYLKDKATVGPEGNFRAVRKELPAETSMVMLFDLVRYVAAVVNYTKPLLEGQLPIQIPANYPPALPKDRHSFGGVAVTLAPERGTFDLYISTQALKDAFDTFVRPFLVQ